MEDDKHVVAVRGSGVRILYPVQRLLYSKYMYSTERNTVSKSVLRCTYCTAVQYHRGERNRGSVTF